MNDIWNGAFNLIEPTADIGMVGYTNPLLRSGVPQAAPTQSMSFLPSYDPKTGQKLNDGWGGTAFGAAQGLFNAWLGMKQYGIAKDTLNENKRQFELNYDAQRKTTNASLADRQAARVASNPGGYQSVGDYMAQYGIR